MAAVDDFSAPWSALSRISFPPCSSPRCLSLTYSGLRRLVTTARRQVAWVTLEGRLVGAAEATSAKVVGKGLSPAEAAAWELFTPLHRVLLVAIVAIASANNTRSRRISQLQQSVDIRDEVLRNMQAKLDDLCDQMRLINDQSPTSGCDFSSHSEHLINGEMVETSEDKLCYCGTRVLHPEPESGIAPLCSSQSIKTKDVYVTELCKENLFENNHEIASEHEERRMSDLSDFCWSVASSADIQPVHLSKLATEQELYNLRNECEEKDATIKDLRAAADASSVAYSKRISELEEVIRRKNMVTTKLKKDIVVLQQQVKKSPRLRRQTSSSSSSSSLPSTPVTPKPPFMTDNILYDLSNSSPSSSDSDSPYRNRMNLSGTPTNKTLQQSAGHRRHASPVSKDERSMSPLQENRVNKKVELNPKVKQCQFEGNAAARQQRQLVSSNLIDNKKPRRRSLQEEKNMTSSQKRWV